MSISGRLPNASDTLSRVFRMLRSVSDIWHMDGQGNVIVCLSVLADGVIRRLFSPFVLSQTLPFVLSLSKHEDFFKRFLKSLFWAARPGCAQGGPGHLGEPPPAVPPAGPRTSHSCAGFVHSPLSNLVREGVAVRPTASKLAKWAPMEGDTRWRRISV